jgi:homoserine kinase type II
MDAIYQVWFVREIVHSDPTGEIAEYEDIETLFGMYSTWQNAEAALERAKQFPAFKDHPECLKIYRQSVNRDGWTGGFVTI